MKRVFLILTLLFALFVITGLFCFFHIENKAAPYVSYNAWTLPPCKTALVLGTAKWLRTGTENPYFKNRMLAAAELYRRGIVQKIILSGDNRTVAYNEPKAMKNSLKTLGVPDSAMVADFAGIRTFDSMARAGLIFGQDSVIVISQRFHTVRAVFLAREMGIVAFGYNAGSVKNAGSIKIMFRELFSRIRSVLDVYVLDSRPRHLGERIIID